MKKWICTLLIAVMAAVPAFAMETEDAIAIVKSADASATDEGTFYVYPLEYSDGAFVFYAEDPDMGSATAGKVWYVTGDGATLMGVSDDIWDFAYLPGEPELFAISCGTGESRAAVVYALVDGEPVLVRGSNAFVTVYSNHGVAYGMLDIEDFDLCYLRVAGDSFHEVAAASISRDQFLTLPGAEDMLDNLERNGFAVTEILYRDTGSVVLNLEKDGMAYHANSWMVDGTLVPEEDGSSFLSEGAVTIATFEGASSARRDVGLPVDMSAFPEQN